MSGWFVEDFTLAELKTLRAVERLPELRPHNTRFDGRYDVPTFDEILGLVAAESERLGRRDRRLPGDQAPVVLRRPRPRRSRSRCWTRSPSTGTAGRTSPVFIQSFEPGNLQWLRSRTGLPLVQLVEATGRVDLVTSTGLRRVAQWADAVGVAKDLVLPRHPGTGTIGDPSSLVADAHAAGLLVHVWTMRDENAFLPTGYRRGESPSDPGDSIEETQAFLDAGVDGLFTDQPDTTLEARRLHASGIRIHAAM